MKRNFLSVILVLGLSCSVLSSIPALAMEKDEINKGTGGFPVSPKARHTCAIAGGLSGRLFAGLIFK